MVIDESNFLDWGGILINEVFGDPLLFYIGVCIILFIGCAYNRVPAGTLAMLFFIWTFAFLSFAYLSTLVAVALIIFGLVFGYLIFKYMGRG